jgi:hypothetical protein
MRLLAITVIGALGAAAQSLDVSAIMARVARNQTRSLEAWRNYRYHQAQVLSFMRGGKLTREERREYDVTPGPGASHRELAHFEGKYELKGQHVPLDKPGYETKHHDLDAWAMNDMSEDMTKDQEWCHAVSCNFFMLTERELAKYAFLLKGRETFQGTDVYRIRFDPKPHPNDKSEEFGSVDWKGEALIDVSEFQPVLVKTDLVPRIPFFVETLLGSSIRGLGFSTSFRKFEDGVWLPVTYDGGFTMRVMFFYERKVSISMNNTDCRRQARIAAR